MSQLPHNLYTAQQVRELDRVAIEERGIAGAVLMERAGAAAFAVLRETWPQAARIAVLCGVGNNGGDGFVVARLAREAKLEVQVFQLGDATRIAGDAFTAAQRLSEAGVSAEPWGDQQLAGFDLVVDGMLGTGLSGEVREPWRGAIDAVNAAGTPVLALDIPSGLDADRGAVLGAAVRANATLTFIGAKQGMLTGAGPDCCGDLHFDDLQVPQETYTACTPSAQRLDYTTLAPRLAPRARGAHKGHFGHVLVIGGEAGYTGAARMAGEAAARSGAGLVSIATRAAHAAALNATRPELMCHGVESARDLTPLLGRASVIAIGPGLGRSSWARTLLAAALECHCPLVVDADALNLLADEPARRDNWVLTPHPGEAARLLGQSAAEVQADRFAAVRALHERFGGVAVLKGAGTLIAQEGSAVRLCNEGNPGLASGGTGDVLTGIIAAFVAQGMAPLAASELAVCLHARAGDEAAAQGGPRGLLASDLLPWVRRLANP
ncbi:MAG: NAD(P)H-hydrate dehydratase [Pseudomonadota bacterium]|nr:MAG: NAD(P)H-hydrate dehydratase [Pseudomonadota bacterium]